MSSNVTDFEEKAPLLSTVESVKKTDDNEKEHKQKYSLLVALCFTLNYLIGSGILGLPYEFWKSGYMLASIIMIISAFLTYFTHIYCVEAIIRAEAVTTIAIKYGIKRSQLLANPENVKQSLINMNLSPNLIKSELIIKRFIRYQ